MSSQLLVTALLEYAARCHADQEVLSYRKDGSLQRRTYREMNTRAQLCALALKAMGVSEGSVIATLAPNSSQHMECWYGIMGLGAVCHTINPRFIATDLEYIINHAKDEYIMLDAAYVGLVEKLHKHLPHVKGYIVLADRQDMPAKILLHNVFCYEDWLQDQECNLPFVYSARKESLPCILTYTSGTTGRPKLFCKVVWHTQGVIYTHRTSYMYAMLKCAPDNMCLSCNSCIYAMVPMYHATAWGVPFCAPMVGARLVLPGHVLTGERIYHSLEDNRANMALGVPTLYASLQEYMHASGQQLHHLKLAFTGGSPLPVKLLHVYQRMGVEVRHVWGMTETGVGSLGVPKEHKGVLGEEAALQFSMGQGRQHHMTQLRIVNDDQQELPWDGKTAGQMQARGPLVCQGYYGHDQAAVDANGWLPTGDIATINEEGYLHITDRTKDVIKSGGEWISPSVIEHVILSHDKVSEAAVIAMPHVKWVERPLLIVRPNAHAEITKQEVLAALQDKVAKWWLPDDIVFVNEMPRTATGKLSKLQLREQFRNHALFPMEIEQ